MSWLDSLFNMNWASSISDALADAMQSAYTSSEDFTKKAFYDASGATSTAAQQSGNAFQKMGGEAESALPGTKEAAGGGFLAALTKALPSIASLGKAGLGFLGQRQNNQGYTPYRQRGGSGEKDTSDYLARALMQAQQRPIPQVGQNDELMRLLMMQQIQGPPITPTFPTLEEMRNSRMIMR